jgi:prepilin-type N-terminal cleavage/methylation domain-containing protein
MKSRKNDSESGFTLIEVIITLVVIAIVAAMMTAYFGTGITQSSLPIFRLSDAAKLNGILEKISAQYGQYPHWRPNTAYAAGAATKILPTKRTGLLYTTNSGGTSGATEPTGWLNIISGAVSPPDGTVTWTPDVPAPTLAPLSDQAWRSGKTYGANSIVVNGTYQYVCTNCPSTGFISGTQPNWSSATTIGSTVTPQLLDGITWEWKCSGPAPTAPKDILQTFIGAEGSDQDNTFGKYHVIYNRFITFNTSNTEDDNCTPSSCDMVISGQNTHVYGKYLKVTIALPSNPTGEQLTTLFVAR